MVQSHSAMSNLTVNITSVLNCLYKVLGVKNASTDYIVDQVRSQWQFFQNEDNKKSGNNQLNENEDNSSTSGKKDSY